MEGHVRGVQNKSKAPRERKDFLVNVFRGKLELLSGFLLSLSQYFSPPAPPSCHTMPFISAKSANRWTFDVPFRPEVNRSPATSRQLLPTGCERSSHRDAAFGSLHRNKFETNLGVENMYHSFSSTQRSALPWWWHQPRNRAPTRCFLHSRS